MTPIIKAKRATLTEYKRSPSEKNLQILRAARNKVKHTARRCANDYWAELSETSQTAAITGIIRGMYEGIKTANNRWRDGWNTTLTSIPDRI